MMSETKENSIVQAKLKGESEEYRVSSDHYSPTIRLLRIEKSTKEKPFGFNLTRSKWDPYPWVSEVDRNTPAESSGLKAGDCVLEVSGQVGHSHLLWQQWVNGEDVLGLRICDISEQLLKKARPDSVTLLLWNAGTMATCSPESLCCGPMPLNLKQLSASMQTILSIIECPVCLETIAPPAMQCQNGHLLCVECRIKAEKCPVCRDRYTPCPSLIAEKIYNSVVDAFNLRDENKFRQKLFGGAGGEQQTTLHDEKNLKKQEKNQRKQKKIERKKKMKENGNELNKSIELVSSYELHNHLQLGMGNNSHNAKLYSVEERVETSSNFPPSPSTAAAAATKYTNQLLDINDDNINNDTPTKTATTTTNTQIASQTSTNVLLTTSKHFSISPNDLLPKDRTNLIAIERCPSVEKHFAQSITGSEPVSSTTTTTPLTTFLDKRPESNMSSTVAADIGSMERVNNNRTAIETANGANELSSPSLLAKNRHATSRDTDDTPLAHRSTLTCAADVQRKEKNFRCPCNCGNYYDESKLQRHVKEDHRIPILCYGSSSADLSFPLRAPILDACIQLVYDGTANFWIKLKVDGRTKSIYVSALLEGSEGESCDFVMETRLRNRLDERILERELITRSIVHSLTTTTWDETFINISDGNGICYNRENVHRIDKDDDGHAPASYDVWKNFNADGIDCELRLNVVKKETERRGEKAGE